MTRWTGSTIVPPFAVRLQSVFTSDCSAPCSHGRFAEGAAMSAKRLEDERMRK